MDYIQNEDTEKWEKDLAKQEPRKILAFGHTEFKKKRGKKKYVAKYQEANKRLSEIKIHLTNHQTETIITSHSMTFQAAFMPSAASLFC